MLAGLIISERSGQVAQTDSRPPAPSWPKPEEVASIWVRMYYTRHHHDEKAGSYELYLKRPTGSREEDPKHHDAFYTLVHCIRESSPTLLDRCGGEPQGRIEMVLNNGLPVSLSICRSGFLAFRRHGKEYCLLYNAIDFEMWVVRMGKRIPLSQL